MKIESKQPRGRSKISLRGRQIPVVQTSVWLRDRFLNGGKKVATLYDHVRNSAIIDLSCISLFETKLLTPLDTKLSNGVNPEIKTMYYTYVLQSKKDNKFYTGYTNDLKERMQFHNLGKVSSTKNRLPIELIYYEACMNQQDATHREKYLKSSWGKRFIK